MATGSGLVGVFESPLTFRLEFITGENNAYIDWFRFSSMTAVEHATWGSIKGLFR